MCGRWSATPGNGWEWSSRWSIWVFRRVRRWPIGGDACDGLIALAGDVPPEVRAGSASPRPRILIGRGTEDEWYDEAKMENDLARLDRFDLDITTCVFRGGHEWTAEFRSSCADFLRALS